MDWVVRGAYHQSWPQLLRLLGLFRLFREAVAAEGWATAGWAAAGWAAASWAAASWTGLAGWESLAGWVF
jgi:hypothetical protein